VLEFLKNEVFPEVFAWLCVAVVGGALAAWLWSLLRKQGRRLLPPQRQRAVPWGGLDVAATLFLGYLFPVAVLYYLLFDPARPRGANSEVELARKSVWLGAIAFPFQLALMLFLWLRADGSRLYQLGLSGHYLARNVVVGYIGWLVLAVPVILLFALISLRYPSEPHPLTMLIQDHATALDWILAVLTAVVAAPILEELLFRGLLQAWLIQRSWGGHLAVVLAFLIAGLYCIGRMEKTSSDGGAWVVLDRLSPVLFVLVTLPAYVYAERLTWRWLPYPYVAQGIYGSALVFAMFHTGVWPTPVALFFLGLGLGYLAYRMQSIVAPMVAHALFNSVACLGLAFAQGALAF
jgi:membrane protease YdiL (CAAX protease family)